MESLIIEGEEVSKIVTRKSKLCSTSELMQAIRETKSTTTPILPLNCRKYATLGRRTVFLIEEDACVKTVTVATRGNKASVSFDIKVPCSIYFIVFSNFAYESSFLFARETLIQSEDDLIYSMPLPNLYSNGMLCTGSGLSINLKENNIVKHVMDAVSHLWTSSFNDDLDAYRNLIPDRVDKIKYDNHEWEKYSVDLKNMASFSYIYKLSKASLDHEFFWDKASLREARNIKSIVTSLLNNGTSNVQ